MLHRLLRECTDIFMHPVKELHYFDTLFKVRHRRALQKYVDGQLAALSPGILKKFEAKRLPPEEHCRIRALTLLSKRPTDAFDYLDLYRPCIRNNAYLGEVTPEYMILPEAGVSAMSDSLGRSTKIILLARNPVQRFLSAVKLLAAHNAKVGSAQRFGDEVERIVAEMPAFMAQQDQLSRYSAALELYKKYLHYVYHKFPKTLKHQGN